MDTNKFGPQIQKRGSFSVGKSSRASLHPVPIVQSANITPQEGFFSYFQKIDFQFTITEFAVNFLIGIHAQKRQHI